MFRPQEIIFSPTSSCNLQCAHCRVSRSCTGVLDPKASVKFLKTAAAAGIERVGFSGGEPFIVPGFIAEISRAALKMNLLFGRIMTNGLWYHNREKLSAVLERVAASGFDGTIGLSADRYHGSTAKKLLPFIREVFRAFGRKDCLDITSVIPRSFTRKKRSESGLLFKTIARGLGGNLEKDRFGRPARVRGRTVSRLDGETLSIPIHWIDRSGGKEANRWKDVQWFKDDFCEGPGQVLYVHPDGNIAPCCGFANERKELVIGSIYEDDAGAVIKRARKMSVIRTVFDKGLGKFRREMERKGVKFPGRTGDICSFCEYACELGLF